MIRKDETKTQAEQTKDQKPHPEHKHRIDPYKKTNQQLYIFFEESAHSDMATSWPLVTSGDQHGPLLPPRHVSGSTAPVTSRASIAHTHQCKRRRWPCATCLLLDRSWLI